MISEEIEEIEDLEFRLSRAQRRDLDGLVAQLTQELSTKRYHFLVKMMKRRERFEDADYAQRNRRVQFDDVIEEQKAALGDMAKEFESSVTIGDVADVRRESTEAES